MNQPDPADDIVYGTDHLDADGDRDPSAAIRIGVAVPDVAEFVAIDPAYGIGDHAAQIAAVVDRWRRDGTLPVKGRDIELSVRSFDSISRTSKRAAADGFAEDGVLAVLGARDFTYGAVRLAERHGIPVIDVNAIPRSLHAWTAPWLFTLRAAQDLVYVTFVRWAHRRGLLDGSRIGAFSDRFTSVSTECALAELASLGQRIVTHVRSDGAGVGSDNDEQAARHFQTIGVDTILPFVSGSSLARTLAHADSIGYRPRVIDLDTGEHATDVSASMMPPSIYDGTVALVMSRVGEIPAGRPLDARAEHAIADVERYSGTTLRSHRARHVRCDLQHPHHARPGRAGARRAPQRP